MTGIGKNFLSEFAKDKPTTPPATPPVETTVDTPPATPPVDNTPPVDTPPTTPPTEAKPTDTPPPPTTPPADDVKKEIDEDAVKAFFKEKYGKEIDSIDNLFKEPSQVEDPLEGVSDEMKGYLKYHKETNGRTFEEFKALNRDFTKLSPLDIAREKAITQSKGKLSTADVDEYLENKLNIDLSDANNLDKFDLIDIEAFGGDYLKEQLANKEKYLKPIEKPATPELITLDNGSQMTKEAFEAAKEKRSQYVQSIESVADKITAASFEIKIDENGTERTMPLSVDYSKEDLHSMRSNALDIDKAFVDMFGDKKGALNPIDLQEGLFFAKRSNREKMIHKIVHKALAEQAKEYLRDEHNVPANTKQMPSKNGTSKTVPIPGAPSNYGVKYNF